MNKNRQPNFLVVDKNTSVTEIEECLKSFIRRDDIDIILINQNVAEMVRHVLDAHTAALPAILEIPSKVRNICNILYKRICSSPLVLEWIQNNLTIRSYLRKNIRISVTF